MANGEWNFSLETKHVKRKLVTRGGAIQQSSGILKFATSEFLRAIYIKTCGNNRVFGMNRVLCSIGPFNFNRKIKSLCMLDG